MVNKGGFAITYGAFDYTNRKPNQKGLNKEKQILSHIKKFQSWVPKLVIQQLYKVLKEPDSLPFPTPILILLTCSLHPFPPWFQGGYPSPSGNCGDMLTTTSPNRKTGHHFLLCNSFEKQGKHFPEPHPTRWPAWVTCPPLNPSLANRWSLLLV